VCRLICLCIDYRVNAEISGGDKDFVFEPRYVGGNEPAVAAKQATSTIPIIVGGEGDLVGTGLVTSLARPKRGPDVYFCLT
jgi:hypothetical protein